jgi:protein-S-isoprenylcysteine O-methyltransferase Ste14
MPLPGMGWQRRATGVDPGRWGTILAPVRLTSDMSFPPWLRDPWVWGQLILCLLVAAGLPIAVRHASPGSALGGMLWPASPWRLLGAVPMTIGLALVVAGARSMGRNLTPATTPRLDGW